MFKKKLYTLLDLLVSNEKCPICGSWMSAYYVSSKNKNGFTHDEIKRMCECQNNNKENINNENNN